jgi:large conductance mechanosensitive channel
MIKGFKEFVLRGNVVQLAVAVVMGVAFGAVVNALVQDIIMPFITAIFGKPDYSSLYVTIHRSRILYGSFINAVLSFLFIAIGVYFFIVAPINHFEKLRRRRRGLPEQVPDITELEVLTQIRDLLSARDQ